MAKTKKRRTPKSLDEKFTGPEPVFESGKVIDGMALINVFRWYNYHKTYKDTSKYIVTWMKKNKYTPNQIKQFKAAEDWRTPTTVGILCKILDEGATLQEKNIEKVNAAIKDTINLGKVKLKEKSKVAKKNSVTKSVADRVKEATNDMIAEIESVLDNWKENKDYSVYDELHKNNSAYNTALGIVKYYEGLADELDNLVKPKPVKDLDECYSNLNKTERKALRKFVKGIIDGANKYCTVKKAVRKPRASKEKSVTSLIKNVKYQKADVDLNIASVHPSKIIGSTVVVLFNTKYNNIEMLVAAKGESLTVSGTTIKGFDPETSVKKSVRKPEENLEGIVNGGKVSVKSSIKKLKTKPQKPTGRMSDVTLIVKNFK